MAMKTATNHCLTARFLVMQQVLNEIYELDWERQLKRAQDYFEPRQKLANRLRVVTGNFTLEE